MLTDWNRSHTLILIGIVAFAALIFIGSYRTVIQPLQDDLTSTEDQVAVYEQQIEQLENQDQSMDDSQQQITQQVPADKKPDAVLSELQQMADKTDVSIDSIASSGADSEEDSDLNRAGYSLEVTGADVKAVNTFLESVQTGDRFMRIDAVSINQGDSARLSLDLSAFYNG